MSENEIKPLYERYYKDLCVSLDTVLFGHEITMTYGMNSVIIIQVNTIITKVIRCGDKQNMKMSLYKYFASCDRKFKLLTIHVMDESDSTVIGFKKEGIIHSGVQFRVDQEYEIVAIYL